MKDTNDLYRLVPELIETVEMAWDRLIFPERAREIIHEIAEYGRTTEIWKATKDRRERFWADSKDATPEQVYAYMCDRVVNAPTRYHRDSSILLIAPRLDELLREVNSGGEQNV